MKLDHVLLGLLAMRPYDGYELRRWLEREGRFLRSRVHLSQIYRLLGRMVDDGWVRFEVDPRDGAPDAKVYRLTPAGREVLRAWAGSAYEPTSRFAEPDFMARFLFTAPLDRDAAVAMVETELAFRREQIAESRVRDRTLRFADPVPELDEDRARAVFELAHEYGRDSVDHWIAWLERVLDHLGTEDPR